MLLRGLLGLLDVVLVLQMVGLVRVIRVLHVRRLGDGVGRGAWVDVRRGIGMRLAINVAHDGYCWIGGRHGERNRGCDVELIEEGWIGVSGIGVLHGGSGGCGSGGGSGGGRLGMRDVVSVKTHGDGDKLSGGDGGIGWRVISGGSLVLWLVLMRDGRRVGGWG